MKYQVCSVAKNEILTCDVIDRIFMFHQYQYIISRTLHDSLPIRIYFLILSISFARLSFSCVIDGIGKLNFYYRTAM